MIRAITVILTAILSASCDTGITEPEPETANVDGITAPITEGVTPMDAMAKTSGQCVPNSVWTKTVNKLYSVRNENRARALYWTLKTFNTERKVTLPGYPSRYSAPAWRDDYTAKELKAAWEQGRNQWAPLGSLMKALNCLHAPKIPPKVSETYNALKAVYEALNLWNDPVYVNSWVFPDPPNMAGFDNWAGVTVKEGAVIGINFRDRKMSGSIPAEIGNLTDLEWLSLIDVPLKKIPAELGNLTNLRELQIGWTQLTGTIPAEIGNLTNLTVLALVNNQLTGSIPAEIANLANLTRLHLFGNQLTGSIPREIGNLTNLTQLSLDDNQLTGSIPVEIGKLKNLTVLYLNNNQLTGTIPAEIGKWGNRLNLLNRNTRYIDLTHNQLTGAIPRDLKYMRGLRMYLTNNNGLCYYPDMYEWIRDVAPISVVDQTPQIPVCE